MKLLVVGFVLFITANTSLFSQKLLIVLDSQTLQPIVGASVYNLKSKQLAYTDFEGKTNIIASTDTFIISSLGYYRITVAGVNIPSEILLKPVRYLLPQATILPLHPREMIQRAFDSFYRNHLPFAFSQNVFYREEFIVNNDYLRFQEMDLTVYQFPKSNDKRKFYISGSYPKVKQFYRRDDSAKLNDTKVALGRWVGRELNFNKMTMYSYTKGVNSLNFIFTQLLEDNQNLKFSYLGIENIKGYNALHIRCEHYSDKQLIVTSDIYLEENSYAVLHFSLLSSSENITKQFVDFKTRTLLWLLGIKIDVKRFYSKMQFYKTAEGFWAVEDVMLMFPVQVKKKKLLDAYINIGYRMDKTITKGRAAYGYEIYQQNQYLFDHQKMQMRFADKLPYAIPTTNEQKLRLDRIK